MPPEQPFPAFAQFFTATCLEWKHLLKSDKYKDVIIESLRFLVTHHRVVVYGFVIMQNHLHLIWQMQEGHKREHVQRDFLKFTAQRIKEDLTQHHPQVLERFRVNARDRTYQFWERNPLTVALWTPAVAVQKLNYGHQNPVRAGLCEKAEDYRYSSALYYHSGEDNWGFLSPL